MVVAGAILKCWQGEKSDESMELDVELRSVIGGG